MRCQPISNVFRVHKADVDIEGYVYKGKFPERKVPFGSSGRPIPGKYDLDKFKPSKLER